MARSSAEMKQRGLGAQHKSAIARNRTLFNVPAVSCSSLMVSVFTPISMPRHTFLSVGAATHCGALEAQSEAEV